MLWWILLLLPFKVLCSFDFKKAQSYFNRESFRRRHFFKRDLIHNEMFRRFSLPSKLPIEVFACSGSFSDTPLIDEPKCAPNNFFPGLCTDIATSVLQYLDCKELSRLSMTSKLARESVRFELDFRRRPFMNSTLSTLQTHILMEYFAPVFKHIGLPRFAHPNDLVGVLLVGLIRYSHFNESGFLDILNIGTVMKVLVEFADKLPLGKIVLEMSESAVIGQLLAAAYQFNLVHTYELFLQLESFKWCLSSLSLSLCCRSKEILSMMMDGVVPPEEHIFKLEEDNVNSLLNQTVDIGFKSKVRYASLLMFAVKYRQLALLELILDRYDSFNDIIVGDALNHALFQNFHEITWTLLKTKSFAETAYRVNLDFSDLIISGKGFGFQLLSELGIISKISSEMRDHVLYYCHLFNRLEMFKETLLHIEYPHEARALFMTVVGLLALLDKRPFWLAIMANQRFLEAVRDFDGLPLWKRILYMGNGQFIHDLWALLPEYIDHNCFALHLIHDNYISMTWRIFILQRMNLSKAKDDLGNQIAFTVVKQMCHPEITAAVLNNPTTNHKLLVKRETRNKRISYMSLIGFAKLINNNAAVQILAKINIK